MLLCLKYLKAKYFKITWGKLMKNKLKFKKEIIADISLMFAAAMWGGGFVAVKDALDNVKPFYMIGIRFIFAGLILGIIFIKRMKNINKKDLISGFIVGIFLFLGFAAQTVGLQYTTAGKQAFLTGVYVVMVPFFMWILYKKVPDRYSIAAAVLTLLGIACLTLQGSLNMNKGDLLTLLCAVFFSFHILSVGYFGNKCDVVALSVIQFLVAAILSFLCAVFIEPVPNVLKNGAYFPLFYLIIFSTLVAFFIQNVAQKYTIPSHAALILSLESFFGSIFSVIFLGDKFTIRMIAGCILIFIAIITSETKLDFLKKKIL
jgi:drug/metabolite transporter (DMT)-like permease